MGGEPGEADFGDELREFQQLMRTVFHGLKRGAEASLPERLRRALGEDSLGRRHLPALVTLALDGPATVGELAQRVGLSPATASLLVGELDRAGFVERHEDASDRRRTIVSLRAEDAREIEAWASERSAPLRRALERLDPEARAGFMAGWRLMAEEVSARGAEAERGTS